MAEPLDSAKKDAAVEQPQQSKPLSLLKTNARRWLIRLLILLGALCVIHCVLFFLYWAPEKLRPIPAGFVHLVTYENQELNLEVEVFGKCPTRNHLGIAFFPMVMRVRGLLPFSIVVVSITQGVASSDVEFVFMPWNPPQRVNVYITRNYEGIIVPMHFQSGISPFMPQFGRYFLMNFYSTIMALHRRWFSFRWFFLLDWNYESGITSEPNLMGITPPLSAFYRFGKNRNLCDGAHKNSSRAIRETDNKATNGWRIHKHENFDTFLRCVDPWITGYFTAEEYK